MAAGASDPTVQAELHAVAPSVALMTAQCAAPALELYSIAQVRVRASHNSWWAASART